MNGWVEQATPLLEAMGREVEALSDATGVDPTTLGFAAALPLLALLLAVARRRGVLAGDSDLKLERTVHDLIERNEYTRAGELRMSQGQFDKALALFLNGGNTDKAALCYLALKQPQRAAEMYAQMGRHAEAAHYFQTAGSWREAAESLHTLGSDREAAELYERAGELARAAHLLRSIGDAENASRLFERAGMGAESAAALLQARSQEPQALRRAAELFLSAGEPRRAAECMAAVGDWLQAAELFEEVGERTLAAQAYERAERYEQAAICYARSGSLPEARTNYERAGDQLRAAEIALQMGHLLDAGRCFYQLGSYERAIETLQQIAEDAAQGRTAALLLGRIFLEKGLLERAREKLDRVPVASPLQKDDLEVLMLRAELAERAGDMALAVRTLEDVVEVDEGFEDAAAQLEALRDRAWSDSNPPAGYFENRYHIQGEIGRGGMGVVYLAEDRELGRTVAVKFLPGELAINETAVEMFRREARATAAMNHPHIVHVYDTAMLNGRPCIVMEYVKGKTVRELMRAAGRGPRGALDPAMVVQIATQTAIALAYAHAQNVIHRDVKPGNILVSERGQVKLMDFGISKVLEAGAGQTQAKGTPQYMPPEQILGRPVDGRTDLYALGISLFEMLAGRRPFMGENVVDQQLNRPLPDLRETKPDVPAVLVEIIRRACAKRPDDRYATANELVEELEAIDLP